MNSSKVVIAGTAAATAILATQLVGYAVYSNLRQRKEEKEKKNPKVNISLPDWAWEYYESLKEKKFSSREEMMKVAIELSRQNVLRKNGGPFGAAIFEKITTRTKKQENKEGEGAEDDDEDGTTYYKLFSVGANRVVPLGNSTLHGEMVAIQFAQAKLNDFSLCKKCDEKEEKEYVLYTSCEPCAMCLGATLWSGVSELVCSATKADAEDIGFNEGPVYPESYKELEKAGIKVVKNVLTKEGAEVLKSYGETGVIYNA